LSPLSISTSTSSSNFCNAGGHIQSSWWLHGRMHLWQAEVSFTGSSSSPCVAWFRQR
jgi:hypothetical protein